MHNFLVSQPDLNLHNEAVQDALLAAARFWLERGVDGFRLDAINFAMHDRALTDNPPSGLSMDRVTRPFDMQFHTNSMSQPEIPLFLERVRDVLDQYGETFSVAEVVGADAIGEMKAFTEGDVRLHSAYNFDFLYAKSLSPRRVERSLSQWNGAAGEGWPSWAFSNHDAPRAVTRWAAAETRKQSADLLVLLLLSLRGNAFLYQGEELGLPQGHVPFEHLKDPEAIANWPRTLGRDGARTPFPWQAKAPHAGFSTGEPWLPVDPAQAALAVDVQEPDPASSLNVVRSLVACRKTLAALRFGQMRFLEAPDGVLAFKRIHEGEEVLCVFNLAGRSQRFDPPDGGQLQLVATEAGAVDGDAALPEALEPWTGYWASVPADRA